MSTLLGDPLPSWSFTFFEWLCSVRPTVIYHHTILLFNTLVIGWLGLCFLLALIALGLAVTFTKTTLTEADAIVASGTPNYHSLLQHYYYTCACFGNYKCCNHHFDIANTVSSRGQGATSATNFSVID